MTKLSKVLHKIRLFCCFFFPILLLLFYSINHTDIDARTFLTNGIVPTSISSIYSTYLNRVVNVLQNWGIRDFNAIAFVYWVVPLAVFYFLTLPLMFFFDFLEEKIFGIDKTLSEFFILLPFVLTFLMVAQKNFDVTQLSNITVLLRHFGVYTINDLTFGGLIMYFARVCPYILGNVYIYVLVLHCIGIELMFVPVYAVLYLIKLIKGGFIKNVT